MPLNWRPMTLFWSSTTSNTSSSVSAGISGDLCLPVTSQPAPEVRKYFAAVYVYMSTTITDSTGQMLKVVFDLAAINETSSAEQSC